MSGEHSNPDQLDWFGISVMGLCLLIALVAGGFLLNVVIGMLS